MGGARKREGEEMAESEFIPGESAEGNERRSEGGKGWRTKPRQGGKERKGRKRPFSIWGVLRLFVS